VSGRVLLLAAIASAWAALVVGRCTAAPSTQASGPATRTAGKIESAESRPALKLRDSENHKADVDDGTGAMWRMLAYMLVIVVLGAAAIVVVKKVLPRLGTGATGAKRISVVETLYLAPRKTVVLLKIGSRKILVANTRDRLSVLADVTGAFEGAGEEHPDAGKQR